MPLNSSARIRRTVSAWFLPQALADRIETEVQGGLAARPLLSVPHIISDEASCCEYRALRVGLLWLALLTPTRNLLSDYHGYVLAEMSVHQTRSHFLSQGSIIDNPGSMLRGIPFLHSPSPLQMYIHVYALPLTPPFFRM